MYIELPNYADDSDLKLLLKRLIDEAFATQKEVLSMELIAAAEVSDAGEEILEVLNLLPYGRYNKSRLADQLNSIIVAHGWSQILGTID